MKFKSLNKHVAGLAAGASLISFSGVYVKLVHVGPTAAGFYRTFIGGVILLGILAATRQKLWNGFRHFSVALIGGTAFALDLFCWHKSILYIGPGLATILGNFQVFFLAAFGFVVLKETTGVRLLESIALAFVGLFMIIDFKWGSFSANYRTGLLLGFVTAAAYSVYILSLRYLQARERGLSAMANLGMVSVISALCLSAASAAEGQSLVIPDFWSLAFLLIYGFFSQVAAWILISRALPHVKTSMAGLVLLLQPALAFIWDILFFGRDIGLISGIGIMITLSGIYLGTIEKKTAPQ